MANGQPIQQPPATTATTAVPAQPQPSANGPQPLPPIAPLDPSKLACDLSTCAGRIITATPSQNFQLECIAPNGCAGANIYITVGYDPKNPALLVDNIQELIFKEAGSGAGANVHITNSMAAYGHLVEVGDIICQKPGSCNGLTIYAGEGVDISGTTVDCQMPGACVGCTVRFGSNVEQCDPGNNVLEYPPMPMYAYPPQNVAPQNQAPQNQQPQAPGAPQPQYPQYPQYPPPMI